MNTFHIALDVVREAFARRIMLGLFAVLSVAILALLFALDLEVIEGSLAAGRLFGKELRNDIMPVDVAMGYVFHVLAAFVFYGGLIFGVISTSSIAADLLAPGRVEMLLALPVRRYELVVGTYFGVLLVALISSVFGVGGISAVLFLKAEFFTIAPLISALMALLGFMAIYAMMLFATTLVRHSTVASGVGVSTFFACLLTSNREGFLNVLTPGTTRSIAEIVIAPLPKLGGLVEIAVAAAGAQVEGAAPAPDALPIIAGTLAFAGAGVLGAIFVVSGKDY